MAACPPTGLTVSLLSNFRRRALFLIIPAKDPELTLIDLTLGDLYISEPIIVSLIGPELGGLASSES